jgi:crotonobetainyl-CoA:carnitine CoA-transferase CaiB-like acyl-CoA transferase
MHRPLEGVRVLDLTSVVVGPVATLRLADYGAEVVKVEVPAGDLMRRLGGASPSGQHSGTYLQLNRRKRNIGLDLKQPEASAVVARLLDRADVLVTNVREAGLQRLGLDAPTLAASHPRLIHCTISGFGPGGPYRGRPAYDSVIQGASGMAGLFAAKGGQPRYVPMVAGDHIVGEIVAGAIAAALYGRKKSGKGSAIEVPMLETMAAFVLQENLAQHSFTPPIGPMGDQRTLDAGNAPLQTADGWIAVSCNTDAQVVAFLKAAGREDALADPRFASVASRMAHVQDWLALRAEALRGLPTGHWLAAFEQADIPAMPCHTLETVLDDPHLRAVDLVQLQQHPTEGAIQTVRPTILFDGTANDAGAMASPLGQEKHALLVELGFDAADVAALLAKGAVIAC